MSNRYRNFALALKIEGAIENAERHHGEISNKDLGTVLAYILTRRVQRSMLEPDLMHHINSAASIARWAWVASGELLRRADEKAADDVERFIKRVLTAHQVVKRDISIQPDGEA